MKIFTGSQIHELDKYTIDHAPIKSVDIMERTARAITQAIVDEYGYGRHSVVLAGPGNNGGDALAVARMLAAKEWHVDVYLFNVKGHISEDCEINRKRMEDDDQIASFTEVTLNFDPPQLDESTIVVDGLFGSGLSEPLSGGFASVVRYVNYSKAHVVSIDMPSGLMTEDNTDNLRSDIVQADLTITIQHKKLAMMFADCQRYVGRLRVVDIRLSHEYEVNTSTPFETVDENYLHGCLRPRNPFANKGDMGSALLIAGSYGMAGAAVLAARACLRSGVGKVTVHTPARNCTILQTAVPEAVLHLDSDDDMFTDDIDTSRYASVGVGPGLATHEDTAIALVTQLRDTHCPVVLDADALNILSTHQAWIQQLPEGLIMTPHPKEFDRLAGMCFSCDYARLDKARQMAGQLGAYIVLKGHYTAICMPDGRVVFNTTGNAGMATAGSGDVLTGIITALLARGYDRRHACLLGVYLHGLAGDLAVRDKGEESLVAGDIVEYLPQAFRHLSD